MKKKLLPVLTVLMLGVMIVSLVMVVSTLVRSNNEIKDFKSLADIVNNPPADSVSKKIENDTVTPPSEKEPIFTRNLAPLFEQNTDCIGWICIPNTTVDYPVMYTPAEPQKYLRKNFEGSYSLSGTPFLQENSTLDCDNIVIYGHNMKNGTMFSDITAYVDRSYYEQHPVIEFETARGLVTYEVISVMQVKNNDPWYAFINAVDEADYMARVSAAMNDSIYPIESEVSHERQILTLSTCYGKNKDDRLIVIAAEQ